CEQIQYGVNKIRKMSTISVNCQFNKYDVNKISVKPEENCKRISGKDNVTNVTRDVTFFICEKVSRNQWNKKRIPTKCNM
ncbi:MAG: hypothetical protein IJT90_05185, partial [Bacteroidaceae bacterium]|nr:hypothetical protein [Bacteroidaceae bacterium]